MKNIYSIIFFIIIISSIVNAQPPFEPVITENGITITFPQINTFKEGEDFKFHFHTQNKSNGVILTNDSVTCTFHLYNGSTGSHLVEYNFNVPFESNGIDWEVEVLGGNFTVGNCGYLFECNSTKDGTGGSIEVSIEITPTGNDLDNPQSIIVIGLIFVLILLTSVSLYFGKEIEYVPFKIFLVSLGVLFLMLTVGISVNTITSLMLIGSVFSTTFVNLYRLMLILVSAGGIGLMLYIVYMSLKQFYAHRGLIDEEKY